MSPEGLRHIESEQEEIESLQRRLVTRLQERGVAIDWQGWLNLIPSTKLADLNSAKSADQPGYRPEVIYAQIDRQGNQIIDREQYGRLTEFQKAHGQLHEAGHRLDWLLASEDISIWEEVGQLAMQIDPEQVSYYVDHLRRKYQDADPEHLQQIIRQEAVPELISQYLQSDGTFYGFVETALFSGIGETTEVPWAGIPEAHQFISQLERFEAMTAEEQDRFFEVYPHLRTRYELYSRFDTVFRNEALMGSMAKGWAGDYEEEMFDTVELVSQLPPNPPTTPSAPVKKELPPKQSGVFDPFAIFRFDE